MKNGEELRELSLPRVRGGVSKESVYEISEVIISGYQNISRMRHHLVLSRDVYKACVVCKENMEVVDWDTIHLLLMNLDLRIESILSDKRQYPGLTFVSYLHGEDDEIESRELEVLSRETTRIFYSVIYLVPKHINAKWGSASPEVSDSDLPF